MTIEAMTPTPDTASAQGERAREADRHGYRRDVFEAAWTIAQERKAAYASKVASIGEKYRELKRQRHAEHQAKFDALRTERDTLLHDPRRWNGTAAEQQAIAAEIAAVTQAMRDHKAAELPSTDDLEQARLAECTAADLVLKDQLDELRKAVREGQMPAGQNYI